MIIKTIKVILTHSKIPSLIDQTMHGAKIVKGRVDIEIECIDKSGYKCTRYNDITLSSQNRLTRLFNKYPDWIEYKAGKLVFRRR